MSRSERAALPRSRPHCELQQKSGLPPIAADNSGSDDGGVLAKYDATAGATDSSSPTPVHDASTVPNEAGYVPCGDGGQRICPGANQCVDITTDPKNCGGCSQPCSAGQKCV
ncbi:MAG: hypothetical protein ACREJ3_18705, partial [Polyangiaceae bacterium]